MLSEGLGQMKKKIHLIGSRNNDLPACSIVSATSRKIAGERPDEANFCNLPNTFGRKMALGLAQSLIEMSTGNLT
jgi:hypothetical protein